MHLWRLKCSFRRLSSLPSVSEARVQHREFGVLAGVRGVQKTERDKKGENKAACRLHLQYIRGRWSC